MVKQINMEWIKTNTENLAYNLGDYIDEHISLDYLKLFSSNEQRNMIFLMNKGTQAGADEIKKILDTKRGQKTQAKPRNTLYHNQKTECTTDRGTQLI